MASILLGEDTAVQVGRCAGGQMCRCPGVEVGRCADGQVCRYAGGQVRRCADVQVCRWAGVQVGRCPGVQVCRWAGGQMCRWPEEGPHLRHNPQGCSQVSAGVVGDDTSVRLAPTSLPSSTGAEPMQPLRTPSVLPSLETARLPQADPPSPVCIRNLPLRTSRLHSAVCLEKLGFAETYTFLWLFPGLAHTFPQNPRLMAVFFSGFTKDGSFPFLFHSFCSL